MRKSTVFMIGVALVALSAMGAKAQTSATTTTEIESPDGTTTTVIAPGATAPQATTGVQATTGTTVVVDPPVAIDAITGEPVSNTTKPGEPSKEKESLRDRVREKMEE